LITNTNSPITRILEDEYSNGKLKLVLEKLDRCYGKKLKKSLLKTQEKHSRKALFLIWKFRPKYS